MKHFIVAMTMSLLVSITQAVFSPDSNIKSSNPSGVLVVLTSPSERTLYESTTSLTYTKSFTIGKTFQAYFYKDINASTIAVLKKHSSVKYVENNGMLHASDIQYSPPSWGLKRASQRTLPLADEYRYPSTAGRGARAYIVDTGIYREHQDFGDRAEFGVTTNPDGGDADCNGHGTHVAGTVGGTQYGIAKQATLIHVKVLGCGGSGSFAQIIEGIDWSVKDNAARGGTAVINLSLGGGSSQTVNDAIDAAFAGGILSVCAAGNDNFADACTKSPGGAPDAFTVAAADSNDAPASFTNLGRCVNLWAPGVSITSAYIGSPTESRSLSGTSMAAPHVAGVGALLLADDATLSPGQLADQITQFTTPDQIKYPLSSTRKLSNESMTKVACESDRDCPIREECCPGQFGEPYCARGCCGDEACYGIFSSCCSAPTGDFCCASSIPLLACCADVQGLCCPDGWQCNADKTCSNPLLDLTPNSNLFNGGE